MGSCLTWPNAASSALLVERGALSYGTSGRFHGLLHSGGRYAVNDPDAARECIVENIILRKIMPHCVEDTGGLFVSTPWDPPDFTDLFYTACQKAGIPVEEISPSRGPAPGTDAQSQHDPRFCGARWQRGNLGSVQSAGRVGRRSTAPRP